LCRDCLYDEDSLTIVALLQDLFPNNPILNPNTDDYPTIGQPYFIQWDDTNQGPTVTLSLYKGCPDNCVEITDIVGGLANGGNYMWTPACTLDADEADEGYGILLIDEVLCMQQWSFHFGLHPDSSGVCDGAAATTAAAAATTAAVSSIVPLTTAKAQRSSILTDTAMPTTTTSKHNTAAIKTLTSSKASKSTFGADSALLEGAAAGPVQALGVFGSIVAIFAAALVY
jgi:Ser-Thr-rich glycosyl-phosphatidyl-inositol-anchored membrane family